MIGSARATLLGPTPARIAGKPGSNTRTSQPASRKAGGSAALTSPKPPVLSKGNSSVQTYKTLMRGFSGLCCVGLRLQGVQHVAGDQHHALVGAEETAGIVLGVEADAHARRNHAALVDH